MNTRADPQFNPKPKCIFENTVCEHAVSPYIPKHIDGSFLSARALYFGPYMLKDLVLSVCQEHNCKKNPLGLPSMWMTKNGTRVVATTLQEAEEQVKEKVFLLGEYVNRKGCFNCDVHRIGMCKDAISRLHCCSNWYPVLGPVVLPYVRGDKNGLEVK